MGTTVACLGAGTAAALAAANAAVGRAISHDEMKRAKDVRRIIYGLFDFILTSHRPLGHDSIGRVPLSYLRS